MQYKQPTWKPLVPFQVIVFFFFFISNMILEKYPKRKSSEVNVSSAGGEQANAETLSEERRTSSVENIVRRNH